MVDWAVRIIKIITLAVIIVLGIVFMPDNIVAVLQRDVASARDFVQREASTRLPAIGRELDAKYVETKTELEGMYRSLKERFLATVGNWAWEKINGKFPSQ